MRIQELTAMARKARAWVATGERAYGLAEDIENSIDQLALANGFTVDEVYAPLIAEQNARRAAEAA